MVHVRLNQREPNPNPHISFITALPAADAQDHEEARQLLRALAAQVRPIMKAHGFEVNSFEEYEHNSVFSGRNWENGEVVELVLRGQSGAFLPVSWLMGTLCHELAHIMHMNHGHAFQALWSKLRSEVYDLQRKGYYGDGYWSSGTRLADSARMSAQSLEAGDIPEYVCGGAQARKRPSALRRRRNRQAAGPSNYTGAQTAKKRKAGSRVTAQGVFKGDGHALNEHVDDENQKKAGSGFRKKAGSKRAREERAIAAERRLQALQNEATSEAPVQDESSDDEADRIPETDQDRRRTLLDTMEQADLEQLKGSHVDFTSDFIFPSSHSEASSSSGPRQSTSKQQVKAEPSAFGCDIQSIPKSGSTGVTSATSSSQFARQSSALDDWVIQDEGPAKKKQKFAYGALVSSEVDTRKKEALGIGSSRRLSERGPAITQDVRTARLAALTGPQTHEPEPKQRASAGGEWACLVCTLSNAPGHLACSACATPRGESVWVENAD